MWESGTDLRKEIWCCRTTRKEYELLVLLVRLTLRERDQALRPTVFSERIFSVAEKKTSRRTRGESRTGDLFSDKKEEKVISSDVALFRQSNRITTASQRLDLVERRIIMSAISKIDRHEAPTDQRVYYVDASDLSQLGGDSKNAYRDMKSAADTLFNRFILLQEGDKKIAKIRWIQRVEYDEGNGRVGLRFSHDVVPFLTNLRSEYTQFELLDIQGMRSEYAIRIYTMLMQYKSLMYKFAKQGKPYCWTIRIDELRNSLQLGDKLKANGVFKLHVLDRARDQINSAPNSKIHIVSAQMTKPNGGRKFTHIEFLFHPRGMGQEALPNAEDEAKGADAGNIIDVDFREVGTNNFSFATEIDLDQAKLTSEQIVMLADWLAGLNKKKNEECRYNRESFLTWLVEEKLAKADDFGITERDLVDYLKSALAQPDFVRAIYPAWLRKLGFKPKKA